MSIFSWLIFLAAALLEVGGDATVRIGLRGSNLFLVGSGFAMLGCYGLVVNLVKWDFSKLLGIYVAVFTVVSVLWGKFLFKESIPVTTWVGLAVIVAGGLIIQAGNR